MGLNLQDEDKRIKKLKIDTVTLELHEILKELNELPTGGNSSLNVKKIMLENRRDELNDQ